MPLDPYANPETLPYIGPYQWEPPARQGIGGSTPGLSFRSLRLIRGRFRNDLVRRKNILNDPGEVDVPKVNNVDGVQVLSPDGSEEWPFLNAFRPMARPSASRGPSPDLPFSVEGSKLFWQASLNSAIQPISAITILYELTVDIFEPRLFEIITDDVDRLAIQAYLDSPDTASIPTLEWSKYPALKILATTDSSLEPSWTDYGLNTDGIPIAIAITGFHQSPSNQVKFTQRFNKPGTTGDVSNDYSSLRQFKLENRYGISSLRLKLSKVLLFNAVRTNLDKSQLPCSMLEYAFLVQFDFDATRGTARWPNSFNEPNFHVKFFSPDYKANSPGFAHSLSLRFNIFSMPIIGIKPGDLTNIGGALDLLNNPGAYWVIFVGPVPGTKTVRFTPSSEFAFRYPGNLIALDQFSVDSGTRSLVLEGVLSPSGASPVDAIWETIVSRGMSDAFSFVDSDGFTAPYLYHHKDGTTNWWYRIVQINQSGAQTYSQPFQGEPFLGKSALKMFESSDLGNSTPLLLRRRPSTNLNDVLNAAPVAVFFGQPSGDRFISSPVEITKGNWRIRLKARSVDEQDLLSTHLIARFWFIPENEASSITTARLNSYRAQSEFYFLPNTDPNGLTQLVYGRPSSLDQLLVSAPLSPDWEVIESSRYIEKLSGSEVMSLPFNFGPNVRARLVVGIYAIAVPSATSTGLPSDIDPISPTFEIELDPDICLVETSLLQRLSYALNVQQGARYDGSNFLSIPTLKAVTKFAGGVNGHGSNTYTPYEGHVKFSNTGAPVEAFSGLFTLRDEAESKFVVPYTTDIPLTREEAERTYKYVDFVSDVRSLAGGRVTTGTYRVEANVDIDADFDLVNVLLRFELMLVQSDGTVVERVFRTKFIERSAGLFVTPSDLIIRVPFLIRNKDVQIVLRTYTHVYSKTGQIVSTDDLRTAIGPDKAIGVRFNSIVLQHHIQELILRQTDSFPGSPAFYEQMPLVPNKTIGGQEFWYIAAEENLKPIIAIPPSSMFVSITGTMYSPVWFTNLPEDIEVRVSAASLGPSDLWVRTVPSTGVNVNTEIGISAVEDAVSKTHHVARVHQNPDKDAPTVEISSVNDLSRKAYQKSDVTGISGDLTGVDYPNLVHLSTTGHGDNDGIAMVFQREQNIAPEQNVIITQKNGEPYSWSTPTVPIGDEDLNTNNRVARGMRYASTVAKSISPTLLVAGWVPPGGLVMREIWPYDTTGRTSQMESVNYLVDGDPESDSGFNQSLVMPLGQLNGKVAQTGSGIVGGSFGNTCAYAIEGEPGLIYTRDGRMGSGFYNAMIGVNFRAPGVSISSELDCRGITLCESVIDDSNVCAFWCGGKIFVAMIGGTIDHNMIYAAQLACGSTDLLSDNNPAHSMLNVLRDRGIIQVARVGEDEEDVPQQRPGLIVSGQAGCGNKAIVYYQDAQGVLFSRIVQFGGITSARVKI